VNRDADLRYEAFAVAAPGLEPIVAKELIQLGIAGTAAVDGGVEFNASSRQLYAANLNLRTASRVLVRLTEFKALTFADLERRSKRVAWETVLAKGESVTLRVTCRKSRLYHSDAVAERIARDLANRAGADVSASRDDGEGETTGDASQLIVVRLDRDRCTISADSSGAHLHQRGYRTSVTQAPMRETLAAALVLASGWDRESPLIDPFCGSGTVPIEAALLATQTAPGKNRRFRFMSWPGFDSAGWKGTLAEAVARERRDGSSQVIGSDRSAAALRAATENAERAHVQSVVILEKTDALSVTPPNGPGWIVSNPPYGVRLGDRSDSRRLMSQFGDHLREEFGGWHIALLAPPQSERLLGFPLETRLTTTNGGLRVHVLTGAVPFTSNRRATRRGARP
jgi:putative N6-adenine-specific DNA methylase